MTVYKTSKYHIIFFILPLLIWFGGIFMSCKTGEHMPMQNDKTSGTLAEEFNVPFVHVIVQLRVDSLVEEHKEVNMQHSIANARTSLFQDLGSTAYRVNRVYNTIPFVALEVSPAAFQALKKSAFVEGITEDTLSTTQPQ